MIGTKMDEEIITQTRWIPISKVKPPEDEWILGANFERTELGVWMDGAFCLPDRYYLCLTITHWAEIPTLPLMDLCSEEIG